MIEINKILNISETEYRELDMISYSLLSAVSKDGFRSMYNKFKSGDASKYGILTESILFDDYVEDDYYIRTDLMTPSKLRDACDFIFEALSESFDELDEDLSVYNDIIGSILAANNVDYYLKKDPDWVANKIITEVGTSEYWIDFRKSIGKIVISQAMLDGAKNAVLTLQTHDFTKEIFQEDSFFNIEKRSQVKIVFNYRGNKIKSMLDWLIIDHDNKILRPFDLKTGGKKAENFEESFFFWRYDIQAFLYSLAIINLRDTFYSGYKVDDFKFVYISRIDTNRPLIWKLKSKQLEGTLKGFKREDIYYKGVVELIKEYKWYLNNKEAKYSKEVYDNSGELFINNNIIINNAKN